MWVGLSGMIQLYEKKCIIISKSDVPGMPANKLMRFRITCEALMSLINQEKSFTSGAVNACTVASILSSSQSPNVPDRIK